MCRARDLHLNTDKPFTTEIMDDEQLLQQAIEAHQARDLSTAEMLYKQVLARHPNHVDASHYLALIAQDVGRHDVAIKLLQKAASFSHDDANIRYNLAYSLQQTGQLDTAKHYYYEAIKLNPAFALAYNNLGVIYQQEGLHEKANTLFEKAISLDPKFADAYYNLSLGEKYKSRPPFLDAIEKILHSKELSQKDTVVCHFALGKIYDDLSLYDQAFEHYKAGNELKNTNFNIAGYRNYVNSIVQVFSEQTMARSNNNKHSIGELIFILGMPRSGTTLVEQIISSHSKVSAGGELGFIGNMIDDIDEILELDAPYPFCIESLDQQMIAKLADRLLIELERSFPGYLVLTDKTPINFLHVGMIHMLFPEAKIIHCQREPLDVCLSCYFQNFNRQHHYTNDLRTLGEFYVLHEDLMRHWQGIVGEQILPVQYEQLVANKESEIRRIIDFCGLDWEDACLEFNNNSRQVKTASNWQVRQPLYNSSVKRWKNYETYLDELKQGLGMKD